jgi:tetratricopeptide (TPR) repeat protein
MCVAELQTLAGDATSAKQTANTAAAILAQEGDVSREALALKCAASAALSSRDTAQEGFDLADKALSRFESIGEIKGQIALKLDIARAKHRADALVEAEDWAEMAQTLCKKIGDLSAEAEAAQTLATVRLNIAVEDAKEKDEPDMASATQASRDALHLFRKVGNRKGEAAAMQKLAQVRYHSGAGDMAKMAAEEAQAMFRELGDSQGEATAILLIAHVMHKEGAYDGAKRNATKAFTLYQNIGDNEGMESCTEFLDKVKVAQQEKTRTDKSTKKTVSDTGLVKLVTSVEDSTHLLSYFADMNEDEDTELGEFDLKEWGSEMNMLKIQA